MTRKEFTDRTGMTYVSDDMMWDILDQYLNSNLDKDAFCAQWKKKNQVRIHEQRRLFKANEEVAKVVRSMEKAVESVKTWFVMADKVLDEATQKAVEKMGLGCHRHLDGLYMNVLSVKDAYKAQAMKLGTV